MHIDPWSKRYLQNIKALFFFQLLRTSKQRPAWPHTESKPLTLCQSRHKFSVILITRNHIERHADILALLIVIMALSPAIPTPRRPRHEAMDFSVSMARIYDQWFTFSWSKRSVCILFYVYPFQFSLLSRARVKCWLVSDEKNMQQILTKDVSI